MPITPLHFGLLAPINYYFKNKVSNVSFIIAATIPDLPAIQYWFFNLPLPEHVWQTHSFLSALGQATLVSIFGFKSLKWVYGAFAGAISHQVLDALVHPEMLPLYPINGNPFYLAIMEPLSILLFILLIWLTIQYASVFVRYARSRLVAIVGKTEQPSSAKQL